MTKAGFVEVLKRQGYKVDKDAPYPTVYVDKKEISRTYIAVKLLAKNVGYNHTFGVKPKKIETRIIDDIPEKENNHG